MVKREAVNVSSIFTAEYKVVPQLFYWGINFAFWDSKNGFEVKEGKSEDEDSKLSVLGIGLLRHKYNVKKWQI